MTVYRDEFLRRLSPEDRAKLGPAGTTLASEAIAKHSALEERAMHDEVAAWLRMKGIPFIHSRMDKKSTVRKGWPDFTCMLGGVWKVPLPEVCRVCCVELKAPGGIISDDQAQVLAELKLAHVPAIVAYSSGEAITFIIGELLS